ncbi:unnamed protein product [Paramecium primaurelia]|uniref:Uncharacterized protein n=1 Tax=Paramecium primaurelia TaxID=5886 RepID=A0A8S1QP88_PARPR|nr:unnamed protein product [Paramecium primaurelia]
MNQEKSYQSLLLKQEDNTQLRKFDLDMVIYQQMQQQLQQEQTYNPNQISNQILKPQQLAQTPLKTLFSQSSNKSKQSKKSKGFINPLYHEVLDIFKYIKVNINSQIQTIKEVTTSTNQDYRFFKPITEIQIKKLQYQILIQNIISTQLQINIDNQTKSMLFPCDIQIKIVNNKAKRQFIIIQYLVYLKTQISIFKLQEFDFL